MLAELEALLAVQRKDAEIDDVERKAAHQQQRADQLQQLIDQAAARNRRLHEQLEEKRIEGRRLSEEVDHLDDHIREQERKLQHDIVSFKELDSIKQSIDHGHEHIDHLEEKALALLDEIESDAQLVDQQDAAFAARKAELEADLAQIGAALDAHRQTAARLRAERDALWSRLDEPLRVAYARLLASVPDPLAVVQGANCGGCHLQLSAQLVQEVRSGTSLARCEHCSRILYLP